VFSALDWISWDDDNSEIRLDNCRNSAADVCFHYRESLVMSPAVLVTNVMMLKERERFHAALVERGYEPFFADVDQFLSEEQCLTFAGQYDGWLAGDDRVTRSVLEAFVPRLKVISKWGTGLDSIDLAAAADLGVPVLNSPGAFSEAVSEVALGFMLMLTRHLHYVNHEMRQGKWPKPMGLGLYGRQCGVIGFGAIGQGIGRRAAGCGMAVVAYDPVHKEPANTKWMAFEELIKTSDVVCLACNLTLENRHLINRDRLRTMKPDAILINVGRGPLIDEAALVEALREGWIAGAGLDVFEVEPLPISSPFRALSNVVLGSHNANNLKSAVEYVHVNTLANLDKILRPNLAHMSFTALKS
jgi:D-3-phosphoglycerate dehydrogenase